MQNGSKYLSLGCVNAELRVHKCLNLGCDILIAILRYMAPAIEYTKYGLIRAQMRPFVFLESAQERSRKSPQLVCKC